MKFTLVVLLSVLYFTRQGSHSFPAVASLRTRLNQVARNLALSLHSARRQIKHFLHRKLNGHQCNPKRTQELSDTTEFIETVSDKLSVPQLAILHGRPIESHVVRTADGYFLTVHRMLRANETMPRGEAVLLHHGLLGSSADWILLGRNKSLPYLLSDAGYDVWMTNARGNDYSLNNIDKSSQSLPFWDFSFEEMGQYDLPAVLSYMKLVRKSNESINFIGHSMGATALLVLLSTLPTYNDHIKIAILLAPLAIMRNIRSPLKELSSVANNVPVRLLQTIGQKEFMPTRIVPNDLVEKLCPDTTLLCSNPLFFITGAPMTDDWDDELISNVLRHVPAGVSAKTIIHYAQLIRSGTFHRFNSTSEYPLDSITAPIVMFSSRYDWLAPIIDVMELYIRIKNPLSHYIVDDVDPFTHTDFVWGHNVYKSVFVKIIEIIKSYVPSNLTTTNEV